ncbi:hypothetical protein V3331_01905 [Gaopeijia maritima]|uniref:hypothetical protein n=1 Tax=Gaopeijia maritima TaxID=3119007 RepID=UPI00324A2367
MIYGFEEYERWLESLLSAAAEAWNTVERRPSNQRGTPEVATAEAVGKAFARNVDIIIRRFKHEGFREEREWRAVRIFDPGDGEPGELFFRESSLGVVPYVTVALGPAEGGVHPITGAMVGPSQDMDASLYGLERLLRHKGFGVTPRPSDIPYRRT